MTGTQSQQDTPKEKEKKKVKDNVGQLVETTSEFDNPYEFNDEEKADYKGYDLDNAIARAWSRATRQGFRIGKPVDEEFDVPESTRKRQDFQFATAYMDTENNDNLMVSFHDARGEIVRESGL